MNRMEAATILIEAEAKERLKNGKGKNLVSILYQVTLEVSLSIGEIMKNIRKDERG